MGIFWKNKIFYDYRKGKNGEVDSDDNELLQKSFNLRFAFKKKQNCRVEQKAGHETNSSVRNRIGNKVYGLDFSPKQDKTEERHGISKVPHGNADNEEEEYEFTPRFLFSLHNQDRKDYVQCRTQDKTYEGYNFVKRHMVSRISSINRDYHGN